MDYYKKGFSLIELMIALAVMAVLMGAILVGITSSKQDARDDAAILAANEAVDKVLDCMDNNITVANNTPACIGSWPSLPSGWNYGNRTGDPSTKIYNVVVNITGKEVRCTNQTGLTINGKATTADGRCITTGM